MRIPRLLALVAAALLWAAPAPSRAEWVPIRDSSLVVAPGSPLDFSRFFPRGAAGASGRVVVGPSGHFGFASNPSEPVHFLCASLAWSGASGNFPDHATADLYAAQLKIHGYTMVRFHFVDLILMTGRSRDFDYDPEQLDRFRYLMAALKRQGLYWMIDAMTSQEGALGDPSPDRWMERGDLKLRVHFDPAARRHWSRLVETLYGSVNPYTGLAPLKDPALALVVLVNENGVEFQGMAKWAQDRRAYPAKLLPLFNAWLKAKYRTTAALHAAWPDLRAGETLEGGTVALPASWDDRGGRMRDTQLFIRSLEANTTAWMQAEIRRLGYPGLVTQYNNQSGTALSFSRSLLPVVSQNTYFDEVDDFGPGSTISQKSSLDDDLGYLRTMMGTRWFDRPFVLTEWGHLFWNRFRHEAGIAVSAYAALQGWDAICQHGPGAIDLGFDEPYEQKRMLLPYNVGQDPVARANETIAALLFGRGDVAEAVDAVKVPFGAESDMLGDGRDPHPDDITHLGLLVRLGLVPHGPADQGDLSIPLSRGDDGPPAGRMRRLMAWLEGSASDAQAGMQSRLDGRIERLRSGAVLATSNGTDADRRRFESETGQIRLDGAERFLGIVTPRTEAASFEAVREPRLLGALTLESASGPALLAVSAIDGLPLRSSSKLLVIMATDAQNTGMTFRDGGRRTIESFGHFPALIERQTVRFSLAVNHPGGWQLTSLHLDGSRGDILPLAAGPVLRVTLDNTATSHGPTTFFLLERTD